MNRPLRPKLQGIPKLRRLAYHWSAGDEANYAQADHHISLPERELAAVSDRKVTCWFSSEQTAEFSKVKDGQILTVKGVFTGFEIMSQRFLI